MALLPTVPTGSVVGEREWARETATGLKTRVEKVGSGCGSQSAFGGWSYWGQNSTQSPRATHTRDRPFDSPSCVTLETASNVAAAFPSSCARWVVRKEIDLLRSNLWTCCSPTTQLINLLTYYSLLLFVVYWFIAIGYSRSLCFIVRGKSYIDFFFKHSVKHYYYFFSDLFSTIRLWSSLRVMLQLCLTIVVFPQRARLLKGRLHQSC